MNMTEGSSGRHQAGSNPFPLRSALAAAAAAWLAFGVRPSPAAAGKLGELLEKTDLSGTMRLRAEIDRKPEGAADRFRPRLRFRLSSKWELGSGVKVGLRLTTGASGDPRSPHETFGQGGGKFNFHLDRAYVDWTPAGAPGLKLTGGKFAHRLVRPAAYGELVIDGDVQPSGALASYRSSGATRITVAAGDYYLNESSSGDDAHAAVLQGAVDFGDRHGVRATVAADAFLAFNTESTPVSRLGHVSGRGNLTVTDTTSGATFFASEFNVIQGFGNVSFGSGEWPVTVSGGYVVNTEAVNGDDNAFFVGGKVGKVEATGDARFFVQYQEVKQEALFTPWAQDDFANRGSGFKGIVAGVDVQAGPVKFRIWDLSDSPLTPEGATEVEARWTHRIRFDCNLSF